VTPYRTNFRQQQPTFRDDEWRHVHHHLQQRLNRADCGQGGSSLRVRRKLPHRARQVSHMQKLFGL
jgi:hypothetical protein